MRQLLNPNPGLRSEAEWQRLLGELVESLSAFANIRLEPTSWSVRDDQPGYASACNCVNVRGVVSPVFRLNACGVVCVTVNFGEAVWVTCDLLLYANGQRLSDPDGMDFVCISYSEKGWSNPEWVLDDTGEWESHSTDERWGSVRR